MISTNENAGTGSLSLSSIESLTKDFSTAHEMLADIVGEMQKEMQAAQALYAGPLKDAIVRAAQAKLVLHTAIEASPELFKSPRTQIFHGIKVGLSKSKGSIAFEDAAKVVELIEQQYGKNASAYLHVTKTPDKDMLAILPAFELKKLGCTIVDTQDKVVIKSTDSELAKTVAALLKDAVESEVVS